MPDSSTRQSSSDGCPLLVRRKHRRALERWADRLNDEAGAQSYTANDVFQAILDYVVILERELGGTRERDV